MTKLGTALLLLVVTSCGGETESDGAGGAGTTLPSNQTLVVRRVFMGETDRELTPDPDAWKNYGRDLDGLVSNGSEAKHCKTQPGPSAAAIRTDGPGGIDNAWGAHLMPLQSGTGLM
ncbi:MAG: hypothetical protein IPI67_41765 [Myxococcales bacterium]|nr:hypothetical protein [Myxococcales bacterium]